jgi:SPP1 gp7 family putative phage head morphogenesis protein
MPASEFLFGPTPHAEAIDFLKGKPVVSREVFDKLLPELKARAFVVSGIQNAAVVAGIRNRLADLPAGVPWDKIKKDLVNTIHPFLADPDEPGNKVAAERRAELLLRTHGFQAYQAAAHEVAERQADVFPFLQYVSMEDGRVRPTHAAMNGIVLPRDHEFWKTHTPPHEWGCRCQAIPLTEDDHADLVAADKGKPLDEQNVLGEYARKDLTATRRLVRKGVSYNVSTPAEKGVKGAFSAHVGDLRLTPAELKGRYDAQTWSEFEAWARQQPIDSTRTVWEWMSGQTILPPTAPAKLPTPPPGLSFAGVLGALGLDKKLAWESTDIPAILSALKKPAPISQKAKILKITGALPEGPLSNAELRASMQGILDMLPAGVAQDLPPITIRVRQHVDGAMGDYSTAKKELRLSTNHLSLRSPEAQKETVWHEMMHWVHLHGPESYREAIHAHFLQKTQGEALVNLGYGAKTMGKRDHWWDAYAGRVYPYFGETGTEVPTRYFQLFANPAKFLQQMNPNLNPHAGQFLDTIKVVMSIFA